MKLLEQIRSLEFPAPLPEYLLEVEQHFDAPRVADVAAATVQALEQGGLLERIRPGERVAVGVGSRGVANLPAIVRAVVERLRAAGAEPFIIAAMGSHGGATPQGQKELLAGLGVTPESVGAEFQITMEVQQIGQIPEGPPLFQDVASAAADHTLLISRIKPHTDFRSHLESGPSKMAVIGLGKRRGAEAMHALGVPGFQRFLAPAARVYEANTNLLGAVAILENAYDETAEILGLPAADIGTEREVRLLEKAKELMASLPFPEIDVLVVRELGKNISGTGMDTNIIGRLMIPRQPENFGGPDIAVITVLDLTEATHGNATGLGLADVTTARVVEQIDWVATYVNCITSGSLAVRRAVLPITMPDDRRALQVAVRCCGEPQETARWVFIRDTLTLDRLWISPSLEPAAQQHPRLSMVGRVPLRFDAQGRMQSPWRMEDGE